MELYSWHSPKGWHYALLGGTNRNKTWAEIQGQAIDEAELRERLKEQAVGESVFWGGRCEGAPDGSLTYPPKETKESLLQLCRELDLQVMHD
jgi:hypothetical protein